MQDSVCSILLIEDNPNDVVLVRRVLIRANLPHQLHIAHDGEAAIKYILEAQSQSNLDTIKLILLDLDLPKIDGRGVLKAVINHVNSHCIPIVIVSVSSREDDINAAYQLGAHSYVVKQINFAPFRDHLQNTILYWLSFNQPPSI